MNNEVKSKAHLTAQLQKLRQRIARLEASEFKLKQAEQARRESEQRYKSLFENSPISLWEEDFSGVKEYLDHLKKSGVTDFNKYFGDTPQEILHCLSRLKIISVNQATLDLYQAQSKAELINGLSQIIPQETMEAFKKQLIAIAQNQTNLTTQAVNYTLTGHKIDIVLTWSVAPGYESTYGKVLVSIIDVTEQKRTEDALARRAAELEEARNFLDSIIENIPAMVFVKDAQDLRFVRLNKAGEELLGIDRHQMIGKNDYDFFPKEEADFFTGKDRELLASGELIDIPQEPIHTVHKGVRLLHTKKVPVPDADGKPKFLVGISEDITERQQAEKALQESEERYRNLVELSPDGIGVYVDGQFAFINPNGAKILGAETPNDIIGKPMLDFSHPDNWRLAASRIKMMVEKGEIAPASQQKIRRLDGKFIDVEITSIPTVYQGRPAIQTVFRDITERKKFEIEQARFRAIMDQSGESILVIDPQTAQFIDVNETACRSLGYTRAEMLQLRSMDIVAEPASPMEAWPERVEELKQAKTPQLGHRVYRRKNGDTFPVEVLASYRIFEGQHYILAIARDITKQKNLEEQLRQAQKLEAVGQLAGGVAHNFNNMLTAIMGYVGLSLDTLPSGHPVANDLQGIQKTAQRAADIVQQLLAFTRSQIIQPEVLDLNRLVLDMNAMLRHLISEAIELTTLPAPDLGLVKVDAGQIEQVLVNLVINASDAMPGGGQLTIETANVTLDEAYAQHYADVPPGRYVMLAVTDTGVGMTEEVKERIFEPFFTTKEVGQGTGLGLATCFGIVKQNNGHISVYSELGQGTTFKIYLPRVDKRRHASSPTAEERHRPGGTETVLLVEDEEMVREMAARVLQKRGYTVLQATNGEEALQISREQPSIHLLITDVVMPKMDGLVLAGKLKNNFPNIKVLYISGYTDNAIVHHGVLEPDINFLAKPFTPTHLSGKVREVLDNVDT